MSLSHRFKTRNGLMPIKMLWYYGVAWKSYNKVMCGDYTSSTNKDILSLTPLLQVVTNYNIYFDILDGSYNISGETTKVPNTQSIRSSTCKKESPQGSYASWKSWNVLDFCSDNFQAWKYMKMKESPGKLLEK